MARGDQLTRILNVYFSVQTQPGLTAPELAKRCKVSERQCYRDLRVLQDAGIPIYNDRGYRVIDGFKLKNISLSLDEALTLLYGLKLLERQKEFFPITSNLKNKILALLPKKLGNEIEEINQRMDVAVGHTADYSGKEELFSKLNTALRNGERVNMEYYSFNSDELSKRVIEPYHLVYHDGFWYLIAFCHRREEVRLFRLDRIKSFELTGEHFNIPYDFDFNDYMGSAWKMERGEEFVFKVRFTGSAVRYVQETIFHPTQQVRENPDGSLLFIAKACGINSVTRWILPFGGEAEAIEPKELRDKVAEAFLSGTKIYENK
jgi:predicted DNA-binding transcriptional regulator YafY